jgi:hypothetical protein
METENTLSNQIITVIKGNSMIGKSKEEESLFQILIKSILMKGNLKIINLMVTELFNLKMDLNMMEILKKDFKKDQVFIKLNQ